MHIGKVLRGKRIFSWKTAHRQLRDSWKTAERQLKDIWETAQRQLRDCQETAKIQHEEWVQNSQKEHTDRQSNFLSSWLELKKIEWPCIKENLKPCLGLDLIDPWSSYETRFPSCLGAWWPVDRLSPGCLSPALPEAREAMKYFVDSPWNIHRLPMTRARAQAVLLLALTRLIIFIFMATIGCRRLQYPDNNREFYILYFVKKNSTKWRR